MVTTGQRGATNLNNHAGMEAVTTHTTDLDRHRPTIRCTNVGAAVNPLLHAELERALSTYDRHGTTKDLVEATRSLLRAGDPRPNEKRKPKK
jgi:hypothetical protein